MDIKHVPVFDTAKLAKMYSKKDGVDIKYVCTTDLRASDVPVDVFYRETPHPEFGNRYFGVFWDHVRDCAMITNADMVEELDFGLIKDNDGAYHYSQSHHDCRVIDGKMVDGGRRYYRGTGPADAVMTIKDGEFVNV